MSTVDLTKVAGFKAVDAEGNDMGVVSLSEMTNMVKESIIQEAVAMQSVSTLAEASTLAATDTYEDKLDISDTFSYVRTLDSSGNPKRTSQNALATVVGGLLQGSLLPSFRSQELTHGDMNSFTKPMMCRLNTYGDSQWTKTNWPTVATQGVFSVTVCGDLIVQEVFGLEAKYGYACRIYADGTWKEWMETAK